MLLLALTDIETAEREMARGEIRSRLEKLPIDAFCLDFVAECLANGGSCVGNRKQYGGRLVCGDGECYDADEDEYDDGEVDEDDDEEVEDDEYDEGYQDFDYNANNDDVKNGLRGQEIRFAENLTGLYCARRDASGDIVYSRHSFYGWQTIRPSKWSLWEECRGLVRYGLCSLNASEKKRVVVRGMSDLEKAQQICALLEENHQLSLTQHRKNQQWLEKCGILAGNSVVLCYGDWESCYLEKTLTTGLFTEKKSMKDAYAITKKEKNYEVGWLFQDWDSYKTLIAVGESGALWYYGNFSPPRAVSADSLADRKSVV